MKSFRFEIGDRARNSGRLIGEVRDRLAEAVDQEIAARGLAPGRSDGDAADAESVVLGPLNGDVERARLQLAGGEPLTLRGLAEIAWALNREVHFELREAHVAEGQNIAAATTVSGAVARTVGAASATGTTLPSPPQLIVGSRPRPTK